MFLYHKCPEMQKTGLASIEARWPPLEQKLIVPHKSTLHAKFHIFLFIGGHFTEHSGGVRSLCSPPYKKIKANGKNSLILFWNNTCYWRFYDSSLFQYHCSVHLLHYITVHHCTGQDFKMLQYSWDTDHECKFLDKEWVTIYKNHLMAQ